MVLIVSLLTFSRHADWLLYRTSKYITVLYISTSPEALVFNIEHTESQTSDFDLSPGLTNTNKQRHIATFLHHGAI